MARRRRILSFSKDKNILFFEKLETNIKKLNRGFDVMKHKNRRNAWIWRSVIALLIFICVSTVVLADRMLSFTPDDSGAIPLVAYNSTLNESNKNTSASSLSVASNEPNKSNAQNVTDTQNTPDASADNSSDADDGKTNPSFEVEDNKVWTTNTKVEIFKISYENGQKIVTAKSADGNKIIAPGTENSYTFKLKNTGDVALECSVDIDAYFTPAKSSVPIKGRVNRYDMKWITGPDDSYVDVASLDNTEDLINLDAGKYASYTLDWMWPYESGDDALDTLVGSNKDELTFTIVIKTTATEIDPQIDPTDPTDPSGPTDPSDPSDPSTPTGPTDPTDPSHPSKPTDPSDPTDPIVPSNPTGPSGPGGNDGDSQGNNHGDNIDGGLLSPKTGDSGHTLWIVLLGASLIMLLFIIFAPKRSRKDDRSA